MITSIFITLNVFSVSKRPNSDVTDVFPNKSNMVKVFSEPFQKTLRWLPCNNVEQGFLTGVTCTPWGYKAPKQGVRDDALE